MQLQQCNCSIMVTAVLEYLVSAFTYRECVTISYFNCASIMNAPRHRILGHKQDKDDPCIIHCAIVVHQKSFVKSRQYPTVKLKLLVILLRYACVKAFVNQSVTQSSRQYRLKSIML